MRLIPVITIFFLFALQYVQGQAIFPDNSQLYVDTVVPRIDITIHPDTLQWLYDNPESDLEFHAKFVFNNGTVNDTIDPVGFRLRGNTSRYSQKKSFKVSFNTFTSGGKYYGVEKLNLNGEHNDPSIIRSKIMWDILRLWDIPAPRSNHVRVYINENYHGLYINVEHIDEEFVLSRFGNNDGNLYKCLWPADLDYLGSNPDLYKLMSGDRRVYELKINEEGDDYSDLAEFIDILNNTADNDLICKLNDYFNTYDYLKVIAADILCGNWDGYIYNKNNFYLYHNTLSGKMEYIPYDVDNTFGIDWFNIDWTAINMYEWQPGEEETRPLYNRIINNSELRKQFTWYVGVLLNNTLDIDSLKTSIDARKEMIAPYVINDPYYPLDYGYSFDDFLLSFTDALGGHVKSGLYPFLDSRSSSMISQMEPGTMAPLIKYIGHKAEAGQQVMIKVSVEAEELPLEVNVLFSRNDGAIEQSTMLYADGNEYYSVISDIYPDTKLGYQIEVTDAIGQVVTMPCEPAILYPTSGDTPLLFINEFSADNDFIVADEYGNYSDWIEVYNGDSEAVYLGDYYLTDNLDTRDKWLMPEVTLNPGGFELFWADGEPALGDHHADFKLSKDGEEIGIFSSEMFLVDTISFGAQTTDISFGRQQDAFPSWTFFSTPTPGATNNTVSIDSPIRDDILTVYPNPVRGSVLYLSKSVSCTVYNFYGMKIYKGYNISSLDISSYTPGLYVIITNEGSRTRFIVE